MELPCHIFLVSMIHRTISLWVSSTEVEDEDGPGDQSRSGLSPHELRRELVEDTEDMVRVGVMMESSTKVDGYGRVREMVSEGRGERVYIRIKLWLAPTGAVSKNDG